MALLFTDDSSQVEALAQSVATRMGRHVADARDTVLGGSREAIIERLHELREAGADTLFIPTLFRPLDELRRDLDRLMAEVAPAFR